MQILVSALLIKYRIVLKQKFNFAKHLTTVQSCMCCNRTGVKSAPKFAHIFDLLPITR